MSARDRILQRLRAVGGSHPTPPDVAGHYARRQRQEDGAARLERLAAALRAAHAQVIVTSAGEWPQQLLDLARDKGVRTLLVGARALPVDALMRRGPEDPAIVSYDDLGASATDRLFEDVDASVTLARSAIAETGSLVLWPNAAEPRLMSLVPPVHFVLLQASNIHADLHDAMREERWAQQMPTNALLISGPSKTADIQQTLAYGAHGPRELIVLITRDTWSHARS